MSGVDAPDAVILDLEDGVAPSARPAARDGLAGLLAGRPDDGPEVLVRLGGVESLTEDLTAVGDHPVDGWYWPKADRDSLDVLDRSLTDRDRHDLVVALVESARGVLDAAALAAHPRVVGLALGEADLTADLGVSPGPDALELLHVRSALVVASAAAGLDGPMGPVSTDLHDSDGLRTSSQALRRLGFCGRSCIHPAQVVIVNETFTPTDDERSAARAVVELFERSLAEGTGVVVDPDGRMVDEAVVRRARRLLD